MTQFTYITTYNMGRLIEVCVGMKINVFPEFPFYEYL